MAKATLGPLSFWPAPARYSLRANFVPSSSIRWWSIGDLPCLVEGTIRFLIQDFSFWIIRSRTRFPRPALLQSLMLLLSVFFCKRFSAIHIFGIVGTQGPANGVQDPVLLASSFLSLKAFAYRQSLNHLLAFNLFTNL